MATRTREMNYSPLIDYIRLPLNRANYVAVSILEKLGLNDPSQKQIDIMETVVQLAMIKQAMRSNKRGRKLRRSQT